MAVVTEIVATDEHCDDFPLILVVHTEEVCIVHSTNQLVRLCW